MRTRSHRDISHMGHVRIDTVNDYACEESRIHKGFPRICGKIRRTPA
ncbi:hypothetical protein [Desulfovibrio sp. UCD-KL4C]|nr:hypothetical protein [Desulfovibrio sp. UCD-KL4C]